MAKTPQQFFDEYNGRAVNKGNGWNDSTFGYQCVAGFKAFCEWAGIPVKATPNDLASGYWLYRQQLGYADYFDFITDYQQLRNGDWVVWAKTSKSHPSSHIAMFYNGLEFGENQGAIGFNLKATNFTDMLGALRPKIFENQESNIKMYGCDVSQWQDPNTVDISKYDYAIVRATWGTNTDEKALEWLQKLNQLGIPYGVYCYSYALDNEGARSEAEYLYKLLKQWHEQHNFGVQLGVWFDMEPDNYKREHNFMSAEQWTQACNTFCQAMQDYGFYTGIYASESYFDSHIHTTKWDRWVASWGNNDGTIQRDTSHLGTMLQYTSNGGLDKDVAYCELSHYKSYPLFEQKPSKEDEKQTDDKDTKEDEKPSVKPDIEPIPMPDDDYLFKMSDKTYDFLNWLVHITPLFITLYIALSNIWHWPNTESIVATISAVLVFLNSILKQATIGYNNFFKKGK